MGMWLVVVAVLAQQPETVTLGNGMTWLLVPRAGEQRVGGVIAVRAGGIDEVVGDTGVAHLLEHLAFSGTPLVGSTSGWTREFSAQENAFDAIDALSKAERAEPRDDREVQRLASEVESLERIWRNRFDRLGYRALLTRYDVSGNAQTSKDETIYYADFPSELMRFWLVTEAQRFAAPVFRDFRIERDVVLQELAQREWVFTRPLETLLRSVWGTQGYAWPVGGRPHDLETISPRTVSAFYEQHYTTGNSVGVLVGGFELAAVKPMLEKTFGTLEARSAVAQPAMTMAPFGRFTNRMDEPALLIAFPQPGLFEGGAPTSRAVARLLSDEDALASVCTRQKLCRGLSVTSGPGHVRRHLLIIALTLHDAADAPAAEKAVFEVLRGWRPREADLRSMRVLVERERRVGLRSRPDAAATLGRRLLHTGAWKAAFEPEPDEVTLDGVNAALDTMTVDHAWVLQPEPK